MKLIVAISPRRVALILTVLVTPRGTRAGVGKGLRGRNSRRELGWFSAEGDTKRFVLEGSEQRLGAGYYVRRLKRKKTNERTKERKKERRRRRRQEKVVGKARFEETLQLVHERKICATPRLFAPPLPQLPPLSLHGSWIWNKWLSWITPGCWHVIMAGIRLNPVACHWRTIFLHLSVIIARLMPGDVTRLPRLVNVARGDRFLGRLKTGTFSVRLSDRWVPSDDYELIWCFGTGNSWYCDWCIFSFWHVHVLRNWRICSNNEINSFAIMRRGKKMSTSWRIKIGNIFLIIFSKI